MLPLVPGVGGSVVLGSGSFIFAPVSAVTNSFTMHSAGPGQTEPPKGCRFDYRSGHILRLWVQSPVGVHVGEATN